MNSEELLKILGRGAQHKGMDITDIKAEVRDMSMKMPKTKAHRILAMRKIAELLQKKQGFFYFGQIHYILEEVYGHEFYPIEEKIIKEIEEWVTDDPSVEYLGQEGMFYAYRLID